MNGSHSCVELLNAGHEVTVFDNFSNSQPEALARVQRITGNWYGLQRAGLGAGFSLPDGLQKWYKTRYRWRHSAGMRPKEKGLATNLIAASPCI